MKKRFYLATSAILSLFIHVILLSMADQFKLGALGQVPTDPLKPRFIRVRTLDVRDVVFRRQTVEEKTHRAVDELRTTIKSKPQTDATTDKIRDIFAENELVEKAKPQVRLSGVGRNLLAPKMPDPTPPRAASAPRPSIVAIDAQTLPLDRLALKRTLTPKLQREDVTEKMVPSLVNEGELRSSTGRTFEVGMRLTLPAGAAPNVGDLSPELLRQEAAAAAAQRGYAAASSPPDLLGLSRGDGRGGRHGGDVEELDALVSVRMTVWDEKAGGGYFRIDISPNPRSDRLRPVAKDVLFLIDCSTSISEPKLGQFRFAVLEAFEYLNKGDRFMVVSFRDRPEWPWREFLPVTPENIARGKEYVEGLVRGGMTDVFAALSPCVTLARPGDSAERPLNIFLLSDGRSTVRDSLTNEKLIREVAKLNSSNVSIYSFSAGRSANRFLLDFLAYHNRGMSVHNDSLDDFRKQLVDFIGTHSDMIVADLKYQITGNLESGVFPKRLPHLYRGETLSVYGRYPAGTENIAVSILGRNAEGKSEELIYRGNVAECPKANAKLPQDWAAQNIYHLLGLKTLADAVGVDAQIRQLAEKYSLFVPY